MLTRDRRRTEVLPPVEFTLHRILHPWRISAFVIVVLTMLAAAFWVGTLVKAPSEVAVNNAQQSVPVFFPVSMKLVDKQLAIKGTVIAGETSAIVPPLSTEAARPVVTSTGVEVGEEVWPGSFLGSVGGRPVFVLPDYVPFYRDLELGDSGDDVRQLQVALQEMGFTSVAVTGKLDPTSQAAIRRIYTGDNLVPPEKPVFRWQDFTQIPANKGRVVGVAKLASIVGEANPLVSIQTKPDVVVARASVLDADGITPGQSVRLSIGEQSIDSVVGSIGLFTEAAEGVAPGKDITISLPQETLPWFLPGKVVNVKSVQAPPARLSVPLVAIQHDADGSYVEVQQLSEPSEDTAGTPALQKVSVKVLAQASGWAAVEAGSRLETGQQVRVP